MKHRPSLFLLSTALLALSACGQAPDSAGSLAAPAFQSQTGDPGSSIELGSIQPLAPNTGDGQTPGQRLGAQRLDAQSLGVQASISPNCLPADGIFRTVTVAVSGLTGDTSATVRFLEDAGPRLFGEARIALSGGSGAFSVGISSNGDFETFETITGNQTGTQAKVKLVMTTGSFPCTGLPPAVSGLSVAGSVSRGSGATPLSAVINDAGRGESVITSAEYRLGSGAWTPMAVTLPDTTFGRKKIQPVAAALAVPDTLGQHTVCVRGTDIFDLTSDGTACQTFSVVDTTTPTVTLSTPVDGATYTLGQSVTAAYTCADEAGGSGLASCAGPVASGQAIDTATVGAQTFTVTAKDVAGNTTIKTVSYTVAYPFAGFFQPVDKLPTVNVSKAGSAIPLKFSLGGDQGPNIFAAGSPSSVKVACASGAPLDVIEETVTAGSSSLTYAAGSDTYTYVWKTDRSWVGTCRLLSVTLNDTTVHQALFSFR